MKKIHALAYSAMITVTAMPSFNNKSKSKTGMKDKKIAKNRAKNKQARKSRKGVKR